MSSEIEAFEARMAALRRQSEDYAKGLIAALAHEQDLTEVARQAHILRGTAIDPEIRAIAARLEAAALSRSEHAVAAERLALREKAESAVSRISADDVSPNTAPSEASQRVLLIDDTAALREMFALALSKLGGIPVEQAASATAAFELAHLPDFAVIVVDGMMPEMTGLEFCAAFRSRFPDSSARLVILSAAEVFVPMSIRVDCVWQKPMAMGEFVRSVKTLAAGVK